MLRAISSSDVGGVRDVFDVVICVAVDDATLRNRLLSRTTNMFAQHSEELVAALEVNARIEFIYRRLGATIVDVANAILTAARTTNQP